MNGNYEFNISVGQEQFSGAVRTIVRDEMQNPTLPIKVLTDTDYDAIVERVSEDIDPSTIATHMSTYDVARHINQRDLADRVVNDLDLSLIAAEIDTDCIADRIDISDVADSISIRDLAEEMIEKYDYSLNKRIEEIATEAIVARIDYKRLAKSIIEAIREDATTVNA